MNIQFLESETFDKIEPRLFTRQEIATFVVVARNLRHWSQENLAAEANVTPRTVQRVEAADAVVGEATLRRIEKAIDLPEGFFTTPMKLPTAEQQEAMKKEFDAKYLVLDATELRTAQQVVSLIGSVGAWQPSHDEREGSDAQAIADLLSYLGEMVELSMLEDCDMRQRLAVAEDLQPMVDAVQKAGLKIYSTARNLRFGVRPGSAGVPLLTGYIRVTAAPMKKFIFKRGEPEVPLSSFIPAGE